MEEHAARMEMVIQLDEALHGRTWARDASPQEVWLALLAEVRELTKPPSTT